MSLFDTPPKPPLLQPDGSPVTCPVCGGIFERPQRVDGIDIGGHPVGHPRFCKPLAQGFPGLKRDARERKAVRRGR